MVAIVSSLDFNNTELLNARLQNLGVDPGSLVAGQKGLMWINGAGVIKYWDGATIKELGLASGGNAETLDNQDGTYYLARVNHTGTQAISTVDGLQVALDGKEDEANKGVAGGYASLDGGGKVPSTQLPPLALTDVNVVATIAARDALTVEEGDVAIVTGVGSYIYDGTTWQEMATPGGGVTAVTATGPIVSSGGVTPDISLQADGIDGTHLADGAVDLGTATATGTLPITKGGTGATTAAAALTALGGTRKVSVNIGDGTNTEYTVNHLLGTRDVQVEVYRNSTPWDKVLVDVERPTVDDVLIRFAVAQATDSFRVVVIG